MKIKAIMTLIGFLASVAMASAAPQAEKVKLSVLYAGGTESPRGREFHAFLGENFTRVGVVQGKAFTPAMADGYDVVVFDPASGGGAPQLPPDFRRPSILIAGGGVRIAMALKLKFDWYCRCLSKEAHGFSPTHAIFNTPLKAGIQYDEQPMPAYYKTVSPPNSLPAKLRTWQVAKSDYTGDESVEPGMVSTPEGFEDSPDSEIISSGINTKGPHSVAIGRQGSFLMWGFETAPSNMTDSAKQVFVNSVAYISKFNGAPVLVRKTSPSRDHAMMITNLFLNLKEYHAGLLSNAVEHNRMGAQFKKKQEAGETLSARETDFMSSFRAWEEPTYEQTVANTFRVVPPDVLAETGQNAQAVVDYYRKNKGYIVQGRGVLMGFDPDAKALGIANNDVRILDRSIELLASGQDQERALRVLKRYTGLDVATAAEWKKWVDTNRSKLFFSDVGGFRFFINEAAPARNAAN